MATVSKAEIDTILEKAKDLSADLNGLARAGEEGAQDMEAIIAFEELQRTLEKLEHWAARVRSSDMLYALIRHS